MAVAMKMVCMVLLCLVVARVTESAITNCNVITPKLAGCINYLQKGGTPTDACCNGVRDLKNMAATGPDRRMACDCLKKAATSFKVNAANAASLPGACKVSIPYKISPTTDCNKIN